MKKTRMGFLALLGCLVLSGCLNNRYIAPVTSFQTATNSTITVLSAFYTSRNSYETQLYLDDVAADPTLAVGTKDAHGKPTALGAPVFSPASIKARLDALSLISVYATRLYALANTSSPADFSTAATALGTNLTTLNTTFTNLGAKDATAATYVGPISSLVGTIGQMYLNGQRDKMVKDAIAQGSGPVNVILSQIKNDMDNIFSAEVVTGANEELALDIAAYNHVNAAGVPDRSKWTYDQRVARLSAIASASAAATSATASVPSQLVSSMIAANNALLASAASSKKDKQLSLTSLNDALSAWVSQIQTLSSDIKPLVK